MKIRKISFLLFFLLFLAAIIFLPNIRIINKNEQNSNIFSNKPLLSDNSTIQKGWNVTWDVMSYANDVEIDSNNNVYILGYQYFFNFRSFF